MEYINCMIEFWILPGHRVRMGSVFHRLPHLVDTSTVSKETEISQCLCCAWTVILKYLWANLFRQVALCNLCPWGSQRHEQLHKVVNNLNPTEDGEASEEPHSASDDANQADEASRVQGHLIILNYCIICACVIVDLHQLQGSIVYERSWKKDFT